MRRAKRKMKFLPYERIKIKTRLGADEACKRLAATIEPKRSFRRFEANHKTYQGNIEGYAFEISPIIHYRNSFLPIIKGEIQPEMSGSSVHITMRPHGFVIAFMILWLGGVGFFFFIMLASFISSMIQNNPGDASVLLIPGGMFAFGYALLLGGFKFESIKSKRFFRDLFQAEEVEEMGIVKPVPSAGDG